MDEPLLRSYLPTKFDCPPLGFCRLCVKLCKGFGRRRARAYILGGLRFLRLDIAIASKLAPTVGLCHTEDLWEEACSR